MEAYEYIRKVKGIPQTESITDLSYTLSIEEVIDLMDGYKGVKNNVDLADVAGQSEQVKAFLDYCDEAGWIKNVDKNRIIKDYNLCMRRSTY